jgi:hypothetical protein
MSTKKYALLTLALIFVAQQAGFAQKGIEMKDHPMLSQQHDNVWGKLHKALFKPLLYKINQNDVLTETEIFSWSGEDWFTNGKVNYQYQDNLLIEITGSVFEGQSYTISDRTTFSYLEGYLAQEIYEERSMDSNELENLERIGYGYEDVNGGKNLIGVMYSEWNNGWVVYGKDEFTFTNGVISEGTYFIVDNFNFIEEEKFTVSSENDTTRITYSQKVGSDWEFTTREIYPGFSPQELFDYYAGLDINLYDLITSYPMLGLRLPDVIIQEFIEGNWENTERTSSEKFYELGNDFITKLYKNFEAWNGLEWMNEQRIEGYFGTDVVIDSAFVKFNLDVPEVMTYMKEDYLYDGSGNLVAINTKVDTGSGLNEYMRTELRWTEGFPTSNDETPEVARHFQLAPAYPNPFNPSTTIQYTLDRSGEVSIRVYDMLGKEVATLMDGPQLAGSHTLRFEARNLSSGIYFVRMVSGEFIETRSMTLVK